MDELRHDGRGVRRRPAQRSSVTAVACGSDFKKGLITAAGSSRAKHQPFRFLMNSPIRSMACRASGKNEPKPCQTWIMSGQGS
jgi:hypothetical protein